MLFFKQLEWPTVGMLCLCYGVWGVAGLAVYPSHPVLALAIMTVMVALHASLQHEALHGHPTRNASVNELLVALPLGVFYPYRRFKHLHLHHHRDERLTDPYDDPESWYRAARDHGRLSRPVKWLLEANNTLLGRIVFGPALMVLGFLATEPARLMHGERGVRQAWLNHLAGLSCLVFIVHGVMGINFALYEATAAYGGLSLIAIRTYCEHRWAEATDDRTVIVEKGGLLGLLFLNNNLHLVHHKLPRAAWYVLPSLYRARRDAWRVENGGYVFATYWDIIRTFALRRKEPVVHPALGRVGHSAPGASFHPSGPLAGPQVGCGAVVPAKPDHG
ncbi:fatty acid desaturase [Oricola cellulosilytica]|uniref:Fatty acid desaturase n=1 Tax=Oricola cellulosilytica TaxID=1429082 RepID=A0A4V2MP78_9HYPH|nr:fatty acid desaturase [Oricola cellulosilytica]TCD16462.1 fatty acid desaturase [Oricola cellulosilytica]